MRDAQEGAHRRRVEQIDVVLEGADVALGVRPLVHHALGEGEHGPGPHRDRPAQHAPLVHLRRQVDQVSPRSPVGIAAGRCAHDAGTAHRLGEDDLAGTLDLRHVARQAQRDRARQRARDDAARRAAGIALLVVEPGPQPQRARPPLPVAQHLPLLGAGQVVLEAHVGDHPAQAQHRQPLERLIDPRCTRKKRRALPLPQPRGPVARRVGFVASSLARLLGGGVSGGHFQKAVEPVHDLQRAVLVRRIGKDARIETRHAHLPGSLIGAAAKRVQGVRALSPPRAASPGRASGPQSSRPRR